MYVEKIPWLEVKLSKESIIKPRTYIGEVFSVIVLERFHSFYITFYTSQLELYLLFSKVIIINLQLFYY